MVSNLLSCKDIQCSTEQLFLHGEAIQVTEPNVTVVTQARVARFLDVDASGQG